MLQPVNKMSLSRAFLFGWQASTKCSFVLSQQIQMIPQTPTMEHFRHADITIAYHVTGEGQDVLCLHGFPDTSLVWQNQAEALAQNGFRVIVPDLRGFGQSSMPADVKSYSLEEAAKDVFALLDHLCVDKVILVGHDWGSSLAWHIASNTPERVMRMAVLSVGHPLSFFPAGGNAQRQRSWYCLFFSHPEAEELITANKWQLWRKVLEAEDPELVERSIVNMSKPSALTAGLNWYRANISAISFAMTEAPKMPRLQMPVLGLWSTEDVFLGEEQMMASEQFVEEGLFQYKRIEGIGHWMQMEAPDVVNRALLEFLALDHSRL